MEQFVDPPFIGQILVRLDIMIGLMSAITVLFAVVVGFTISRR